MAAPRRRIALLIVLGGCAGVGSNDGDSAFRERHLATIPEDARVLVPVEFSADGRQAAWVEQRDGTCRAVRGSRKGKPYGIIC